jgi:transcriptional regulator with XRE-family HTH domain
MIVLDTKKFAKDAKAHLARSRKTQAEAASVIGISSSALSGILRGSMPSVAAAASVCFWMKKDINTYFKEGLPHGLLTRWSGTHTDGRAVVITQGPESASFIERATSGKILNRQTANYGNGAAARYFEEFRQRYLDLDFTETEHLTA